MIAASKEEIKKWFIAGVAQGHKYMLIVYDRMEYPDNSDSPYYAESAESARDKARACDHDEMCEVMEIYDLTAGMESQLAEKRAWNLPEPPERESRPDAYLASGLLNSSETRLQFMGRKNAEYIKEHFGGPENVVPRPARVFTDDSREYVHAISAYIMERSGYAGATVAIVYRFGPDGGAKAYNILLADEPEEDRIPVNFPLTQHYEVKIDEPYITFGLLYATGKDTDGPAFKQRSDTATEVFMEDHDCYGMHSRSSVPYVDNKSHRLYEQAMERLSGGGKCEETMDLLHKAADEGHADAAFALGNCYGAVSESDIGWNKDKASFWYEKAVLLGHEKAKERLEDINKFGTIIYPHS